MVLRPSFVALCAGVLTAGIALGIWLDRERERLLDRRVPFLRNQTQRLVLVRDFDGRGNLTESSLFGDGGLLFEVHHWTGDPWSPESSFLDLERPQEGASRGQVTSVKARSRLPRAELERVWEVIVTAGLFEYDTNRLRYQQRAFGRPSPLVRLDPGGRRLRRRIFMTLDSGLRTITFDASGVRALAKIYPELRAYEGAARLLERIESYRLLSFVEQPVPGSRLRSTANAESNLQ